MCKTKTKVTWGMCKDDGLSGKSVKAWARETEKVPRCGWRGLGWMKTKWEKKHGSRNIEVKLCEKRKGWGVSQHQETTHCEPSGQQQERHWDRQQMRQEEWDATSRTGCQRVFPHPSSDRKTNYSLLLEHEIFTVQCSGSELLPRPGAASPAVPSMRKAIPVFCTGQQEKLLILINY